MKNMNLVRQILHKSKPQDIFANTLQIGVMAIMLTSCTTNDHQTEEEPPIIPWQTTNEYFDMLHVDATGYTNHYIGVIGPQVGNTNELITIESSDPKQGTRCYRRDSTGGLYRVSAPKGTKG